MTNYEVTPTIRADASASLRFVVRVPLCGDPAAAEHQVALKITADWPGATARCGAVEVELDGRRRPRRTTRAAAAGGAVADLHLDAGRRAAGGAASQFSSPTSHLARGAAPPRVPTTTSRAAGREPST